MNKELTIWVGKTYRGKRFRGDVYFNNDRVVVWIGPLDQVQYDSDTIKSGQLLPIVSMEKFKKWVRCETPQSELDARKKKARRQG